MRLKVLVAVGLVLSLFGLASCGGSDEDDGNGGETSEQSTGSEGDGEEGQAAPEPDLEGVPDVVAEVNGTEIDREEFASAYEGQFQQMAAQAQMSGQELDQEQLKKQTAETLVNSELLVQEADERGVDASDAAVDRTLDELAQQNGMSSSDEFLKALEEQGTGEEEVRDQVRTQVQIEGLIADEAGEIKPTQAELRKAYRAAKQQQEQAGGQGQGQGGQELPPFKKLRPQLAEQVKTEKQNEVGQELVGDLREDADITVHL